MNEPNNSKPSVLTKDHFDQRMDELMSEVQGMREEQTLLTKVNIARSLSVLID